MLYFLKGRKVAPTNGYLKKKTLVEFIIHLLIRKILSLSQFVCPLFYFGMSQNIVMFLKKKVINLLMFLLYL